MPKIAQQTPATAPVFVSIAGNRKRVDIAPRDTDTAEFADCAMKSGFRLAATALLLTGLLGLNSLPAVAGSGHQHDVQPATKAIAMAQTDKDSHDHGSEGGKDDGHGHGSEGDKDDGHGHGEEGEQTGELTLTAAQRSMAGIKVSTIMPREASYALYAPAEIITNAYNNRVVTPRIDSQVLVRHAALGDEVRRNQPLVTLFSQEMATAQATHINAANEWRRISGLSNNVVSAKTIDEAKTAHQQSHDSLRLMGMTDASIQKFTNGATRALGEYQLLAPSNGIVLMDDFRQGERIDAGRILFEIADESNLWVEASVMPQPGLELPKGMPAKVVVGNITVDATVTQAGHAIDEISRTRLIRLTVDNPDHLLHAGQFADVYFQQAFDEPVMILPEAALVRTPDGDWGVFVEIEPGTFRLREIKRGMSIDKAWQVEGLSPGASVVIDGAFYLISEQAKAGFDIHNH